jgi:hypothetical protein
MRKESWLWILISFLLLVILLLIFWILILMGYIPSPLPSAVDTATPSESTEEEADTEEDLVAEPVATEFTITDDFYTYDTLITLLLEEGQTGEIVEESAFPQVEVTDGAFTLTLFIPPEAYNETFTDSLSVVTNETYGAIYRLGTESPYGYTNDYSEDACEGIGETITAPCGASAIFSTNWFVDASCEANTEEALIACEALLETMIFETVTK